MNDPELFATLGPAHATDLEEAVAWLERVDPGEADPRNEIGNIYSLRARLDARAKAIREIQP